MFEGGGTSGAEAEQPATANPATRPMWQTRSTRACLPTSRHALAMNVRDVIDESLGTEGSVAQLV
jgi:hypothetical protein